MKVKNRRRRLIISSGLQFRYVGGVLFAMLFVSMVVGYFIYQNIWNVLLNESRYNDWSPFLNAVKDQTDRQIFFGVAISIVLMMIVSVYMSHKIAGPLYRLKKCFLDVAKGDLSFEMRLRKGDELMDLVDDFNGMLRNLKGMVDGDRQKVKDIQKKIEETLITINKPNISPQEKQQMEETLKTLILKLKEVGSQYKI
ncbi:MAG: methyl-accepting chemotaxis protein [bacterium]|nr:methyl-accepting chemotaxis protein [bacterium]MDD5756146.1 methyl-accepting chemotaxis protein [bacterium]